MIHEFTYDEYLRRWGVIKDALGLTPAEDNISGISLIDVEQTETGSVQQIEIGFACEDAIKIALGRLQKYRQTLERQGCYDEAKDVTDFRSELEQWSWQFERSQ